jgi:predicted lysophospholipase L1 biosynthesis ABC-type transport system permease subunit
LPFFYIVGSPEDFARFPTTYFGYLYGTPEEVREVQQYVTRTLPNVSIIDTGEVREISEQVIKVLLLLTYVIAFPALLLACLLVLTLVLTAYAGRRRDGARFLALGMRMRAVTFGYGLETISTTLLASVGAYLLGLWATKWLVVEVLAIEVATYGNIALVGMLALLVAGVGIFGMMLWWRDTTPLQQTLIHEENY